MLVASVHVTRIRSLDVRHARKEIGLSLLYSVMMNVCRKTEPSGSELAFHADFAGHFLNFPKSLCEYQVVQKNVFTS